MKHLKTFGLAALVVAAFSALSGVASASAAEFHATEAGVAVSGEQTTGHKFTITGSSVTFTTAQVTGTTGATASTTFTLHPVYSGVTAFGFSGAIVTSTGCLYNFHTQTGTFDIVGCSAGGIIIEVNNALAKCMVDIPNQTGINGQSWATGGTFPNRDVIWTTNASNISATTTTSTGLCPLTVGKDTGVTYTGTTTITAASGEVWYGP
jgi:hypothetical protein